MSDLVKLKFITKCRDCNKRIECRDNRARTNTLYCKPCGARRLKIYDRKRAAAHYYNQAQAKPRRPSRYRAGPTVEGVRCMLQALTGGARGSTDWFRVSGVVHKKSFYNYKRWVMDRGYVIITPTDSMTMYRITDRGRTFLDITVGIDG